MAIGKSLGAGVPIAAALFSERVAAAAAFGDHGSTYGGNLLACRAALVFLEELVDGGLMAHVAARRRARRGQAARARGPPRRASAKSRGAGLMWGLELDRPAAPVVDAAIQQGLLVNRTAETVVRLLPPYIITAEEIDEAIGLLDAALHRGIRGTTADDDGDIQTGNRGGRGGGAPADLGQPRGPATCCRARSTTSSSTRRVSSSPSATGAVIACAELAPLSKTVAEVRSLVVDRARRGNHIGPRLVTELASARCRARLRDALRVHPSAVALRQDGIHDRAAHVGAGEDRARLHVVPAVPALRPVCRHAAAARRRADPARDSRRR